ncbi:MAG: hypothetical protein M9924_17620 [Rhizobiaceae bacterium]|nr:hypothetical protein [Rhizobiaceae bacterium]
MRHNLFPLPAVPDPADIRTLGQYIALGVDIRARCTSTGCNHNVHLNLVVLTRYLGPHHSAFASDLKPYFYCPDCRTAGLADENIAFSYYACTAPHTVLDEIVHEEHRQLTAA